MQYFPKQYRRHIKATSAYILEELWEKSNVNLSFLMFKDSFAIFCPKMSHLASVHKRYWICSQVTMEWNLFYIIKSSSDPFLPTLSPGYLRADSFCEARSCRRKNIFFIWSWHFGQISNKKPLSEPLSSAWCRTDVWKGRHPLTLWPLHWKQVKP